MRAARYHGPKDIRIEEIDPDIVGSDDVRIAVKACGICGPISVNTSADRSRYPKSPIQ